MLLVRCWWQLSHVRMNHRDGVMHPLTYPERKRAGSMSHEKAVSSWTGMGMVLHKDDAPDEFASCLFPDTLPAPRPLPRWTAPPRADAPRIPFILRAERRAAAGRRRGRLPGLQPRLFQRRYPTFHV